MLQQELGVERAGIGQALQAQPRVRRKRAGIPAGVILAKQCAKSSG
jgi:hypothetical protein